MLDECLVRASEARAEGRHADALACFREALDYQPDHPVIPIEIVETLQALGRVSEAQASLGEVAANADLSSFDVCFKMAGVCFGFSDYPQAIHFYQSALSLKPAHISARASAALTYIKLGQLDEAKRIVLKLLDERPGWERAQRYLTQIERAELIESGSPAGEPVSPAGQMEQQETNVNTGVPATAVVPVDRFEEYSRLARDHFQRFSYQTAIEYYRKALESRPDDCLSLANMAYSHIQLGEYAAARALLDRLILEKPDWERPYRYLSRLARAEGERALALHFSRMALERDSGNSQLVLMLVAELREFGELAEAEALLDGHEALLASSGLAWHQRGLIAQFRDDLEAAFRYFDQGIVVQPDEPRCYEAKIMQCLFLGLFDEAEQTLHSLVDCCGRQCRYVRLEVPILRGRGFFREALDLARSLREEFPRDFRLRTYYVDLLIRLAEFEAAELELAGDMSDVVSESKEIFILKAELERAQYRVERALEYVAKALELGQPLASELRLQALLYLMQGDTVRAGESLKVAGKSLSEHGSKRSQVMAKSGLWYEMWLEMRTNPFAEAELMRAQTWPLPQQAARVSRVLEAEPEHASSAVVLLRILRQTGVFDLPPLDAALPIRNIPRRIIQFWDDPAIPEDVLANMLSWREHNPGFGHVVFNDRSAEDFLMERCHQDVWRAFRMAAHPALRADVFRLAWLYAHGGIYADADDLCRSPLVQWLPRRCSLMLLQEDIGSIGNNLIATAPRHPLIGLALERVTRHILERQGHCIWFISGPGALSQTFCNYYLEDLRQSRVPEGVVVIQRHEAERSVSMHLTRACKQTSKHWISTQNRYTELIRRPGFASRR